MLLDVVLGVLKEEPQEELEGVTYPDIDEKLLCTVEFSGEIIFELEVCVLGTPTGLGGLNVVVLVRHCPAVVEDIGFKPV